MKYIFILGRDPELSILEVISYLKRYNINYEVIDFSNYALVLDLEKLDFEKTIRQLGGTLKICEVISERLPGSINIEPKINSDKIDYSISYYGQPRIDLLKLNNLIKQRLKSLGYRKVYHKPPKRNTYLMPTESVKLLEKGIEFNVYSYFLGITIATSNPLEYEFRDKRPVMDEKKLTSPRLAKILVNLSGAKEGSLLLDPFCGIGSIMQEALLMNINTIGVDNDEQAVNATVTNLKWFEKNFKFNAKWKVYDYDSRGLSNFLKEKPNVVATEPYMGMFFRRLPTTKEALRVVKEVEPLYYNVLNQLKKIGVKTIVFIVPRFVTSDNTLIRLDFDKIIKGIGFKIITPFEKIKMPIIYRKREGNIEREIYILSNA